MSQPSQYNNRLSSVPPSEVARQAPSDSMKKYGLWAVLTSIFLMWTFLYVVFQVFNPSIVQKGDNCRNVDPCDVRPPDNGKCFVAALVVTIVLMLLIYLIFASMK